MITTLKLSDVKLELPSEYDMYNANTSGLEAVGTHVKRRDFNFKNNPASNENLYHSGYIEYLKSAWKSHFSIVLKPDDIWYMILSELTTAIAKDSKKYKSLFSIAADDEKIKISVPTGDPEEINEQLIINALKNRVPSDVNSFLPKFSTTTPIIQMAMNICFCDLVSPYYSYSTYLCGIPNIRIEGEIEDWELVMTKLMELSIIFSGTPLRAYIDRCLNRSILIIGAIKTSNSEFFQKIFKIKHCGSGHDTITGWILEFLKIKDYMSLTVNLVPPHISKMDWINLDTQRTFSIYAGLFFSKIEGEFLVPEYDFIQLETTKREPQKNTIKEMLGNKPRQIY